MSQSSGSAEYYDKSREGRAVDRRHTTIIAIISGVIGIIGALAGSYVQIYGAAQTNNSDIKEARAKEDREHRADAYVAFLAAAEKSSDILVAAKTCVEAEPSPKLDTGMIVLRDVCAQEILSYSSIWQTMVDAGTRVSIYGSQEAFERARQIANTLPEGPWADPGHQGKHIPLDGYNSIFKFDFGQYKPAHDSFLLLVCQELVNSPRGACL